MQWNLIGAAFGSGLLMLPTATFSQQYPSKLVRLVIPYPAGGPTDTVGRLLAQRLRTNRSDIPDRQCPRGERCNWGG